LRADESALVAAAPRPRAPRLRRTDCSAPGIRRLRHGRGFRYVDELTGERIADEETLERIAALVIPPAWSDVWISPWPNGHIQAVGVDRAGRKQYRYHDRWRERRDQQKFDQMLAFARVLPRLRAVAAGHLQQNQLTRERVLAGAVRLLDRGFFRIGGEDYAEQNETFGLATMQKRHVKLLEGNVVVFDYQSKAGKRRVQSVVDGDVFDLVSELKRRRGGGAELLAYRDHGGWRDVRSADINEYIKAVTGSDFSAKDFRTWHATVLAAVALAVSRRAAVSKTARKRAITRAVNEVAYYLGNTPAVCRASYIDPRVFDRYETGWTIGGALDALGEDAELGEPATQGAVEEAVLDLLEDEKESHALEKVEAAAAA
jgi:DNA topoisomerase IB